MVTNDLRLVVDPRDPDIVASALRCEADVFLQRYGIDSRRMAAEYGPYDADTVWLVVMNAMGHVVAGSRLIPPNPRGLKSLHDAARPPWNLDPDVTMEAAGLDPYRTWDVATLFRARTPRHSGIDATAALCHGIIQVIRHNGGSALVAVLDATAREMLDRFFALRVRMLPGATRQLFMNTPNDPTFAFISELLSHSRRINPEGYRMYALGAGITGVETPAPGGFALRPEVVDLRDREDLVVIPEPRSFTAPSTGR